MRSKFFLSLLLVFYTTALQANVKGIYAVETEVPSHDKFIVHAIPKCGTHYIERTISLLVDKKIINCFLSQEALGRQDVIIRTFSPFHLDKLNMLKNNKIKIVAMYRDPRDALISMLFYMRTFKGQGTKRDFFTVSQNFDQLTFDQQLTALIIGTNDMKSYLKFYASRIPWVTSPYSLAIRFEDLVGDEGGGSDSLKEEAIVKIANYINMELSQEKLKYVFENMYMKKDDKVEQNKTFVRASIGNWKTFFKPQHIQLFKERFGGQLIQLGYEKDYNW